MERSDIDQTTFLLLSMTKQTRMEDMSGRQTTRVIDDVEHTGINVGYKVGRKHMEKQVWVSPDGTIAEYDVATNSYIDIRPYLNLLDNEINFMRKYWYVVFGDQRVLLCELVCRAYHPDFNSRQSHDKDAYFFRDNNFDNCSVGNIIYKPYK